MPRPLIEKLRRFSPIVGALLTVLTVGCDGNGSFKGSPSFTDSSFDYKAGTKDPGIARGKNQVTVTVKGAVVKPGVYVLNTGASVAEAIVEAGGLTDQATLVTLNLKSPLRDKMVLKVPKVTFPVSHKSVSPIPGTADLPALTRTARSNHAAPSAAPAPAGKVTGILKVTVKGAVSKPGTYYLLPGEPVASAIIAAGGPAKNADMGAVRLNGPVQQGMTVTVPTAPPKTVFSPKREEPAPVPAASPAQAAGSPSIDINHASAEQMQRLPGIGPSLAARIVAYRNEVGAFRAPEQLLDVKGISPEKFARIHALIQTK